MKLWYSSLFHLTSFNIKKNVLLLSIFEIKKLDCSKRLIQEIFPHNCINKFHNSTKICEHFIMTLSDEKMTNIKVVDLDEI
jgi:hypothetical protein